MKKNSSLSILVILLFSVVSCSEKYPSQIDIVNDLFPEEQVELRTVVESIVRDAETANLEGLKSIHLVSDKFTKFGPRGFERQGVQETNESEVAFFGIISNYKEEVVDLKIDVFGSTGITTYYRNISFQQDGEKKTVSVRQTLVFLKTSEGWKIIHEHGNKKQE